MPCLINLPITTTTRAFKLFLNLIFVSFIVSFFFVVLPYQGLPLSILLLLVCNILSNHEKSYVYISYSFFKLIIEEYTTQIFVGHSARTKIQRNETSQIFL